MVLVECILYITCIARIYLDENDFHEYTVTAKFIMSKAELKFDIFHPSNVHRIGGLFASLLGAGDKLATAGIKKRLCDRWIRRCNEGTDDRQTIRECC